MSSIGPQLPPHLSKRKRSSSPNSAPNSPPSKASRPNQDEIALHNDSSDDEYGPSAPKAATASIGPAMPPSSSSPPPRPSHKNTDEIALDDDDSDDDTGPAPPAPPPVPSAPKRVLGPAAPPAALSERPPSSPHSDSDSDDDDYGPALPGSSAHVKNASSFPNPLSTISAGEPEVPKRDDWMLAPPTGNQGYQERDPTKIKARKFASGTSATKRPGEKSGGVSAIWTETPEEKARRLKDAVLGRGDSGSGSGSTSQQTSGNRGGVLGVGGGSRGDEKSEHHHDRIRSFTEATRGKSLYEEHQAAKKAGKATNNGGARKGGADPQQGDDEDDDPSKRAFDREKDMGLGMRITASQRKELLNRASDFGGRFSKGNYL